MSIITTVYRYTINWYSRHSQSTDRRCAIASVLVWILQISEFTLVESTDSSFAIEDHVKTGLVIFN